MTLIEALRTIEEHMLSGVHIECWMRPNGMILRRVMFNDGEAWARTTEEFAAAIEANRVLATIPTNEEDFMNGNQDPTL